MIAALVNLAAFLVLVCILSGIIIGAMGFAVWAIENLGE